MSYFFSLIDCLYPPKLKPSVTNVNIVHRMIIVKRVLPDTL